MVRGRQDMEEWGVSFIFKEAGMLLFKSIRILHPIILAFLLPIALILFLEVIVVAWMLAWLIVHGALRYQFGFHSFGAFSEVQATTDSQPLPPFVPQMLLTLSLFILTWPLLSLATAAIAKAVQHIYSHHHRHNIDEHNPSTVKSIFTSLPASFFPILITSLWFLPVNLLAYFILSLPFYVLSASPKINPQLLESFHQGLCFVAFLFLDSWFRLSLQVAVLEPERYGLVALKRSGKLVKSKVHTALELLAVCVVFYFAHVAMLEVIFGIPVYEEWPIWVMYPFTAVVSVVYVAFMAYWLVVMSVFYFVSKGKCGGEEALVCEGNAYQPLGVGSS